MKKQGPPEPRNPIPELGVTPPCLGNTVAASNAWKRATEGLPAETPARVLEMAIQVAILIMKERKYMATRMPEGWKPADWDRAQRETIKLRKEISKAMLAEIRVAQRGRNTDEAVDPRHASRASGVLSLVRSGSGGNAVN